MTVELSVYLTEADENNKISCIRAVRGAMSWLAVDPGLKGARLTVEAVIRSGEPCKIGEAEDEEKAHQAIRSLEESGHCKGSIGRPAEAEGEGDESEIDWNASIWQTAMILLAAAGGSPTGAQHLCKLLAKSTHDSDYFADVAGCYEDVFPVIDNPLAAALLGGARQ